MYDFLFSFFIFSGVFSVLFLFFVSFFIFFVEYEDGPETAVVTGALGEELGRESKLGTGGGGRITATIAVFFSFFSCRANNLNGGAVERAGRGRRGRGRGLRKGATGRGLEEKEEATRFILTIFCLDTSRSDGGGFKTAWTFLLIQLATKRNNRWAIVISTGGTSKTVAARTKKVG